MSIVDLTKAADGSSRNIYPVGTANYRIINPFTKQCLTANLQLNGNQIIASSVTGSTVVTPDVYVNQVQVWTVQGSRTSSDNVTIAFPSLARGHSPDYRLDLSTPPVIVNPTVVSGVDNIPNKLPPPYQMAGLPTAVAPAAPAIPTTAPSIGNAKYMRSIPQKVSQTGGDASIFQMLKTSSPDQVFIYSPSTDSFLGFLTESLVIGAAGPTLEAFDLASYFNDVNAYTKSHNQDPINIISPHLKKFIFQLVLDDGGPGSNDAMSFRLVDESNGRALSLGAFAPPVDPTDKSQIWDFKIAQDSIGDGKIWYNVTSRSSTGTTLSTNKALMAPPKWRLIRVHPPTTPPNAFTFETPTPDVPIYAMLVSETGAFKTTAKNGDTVNLADIPVSDDGTELRNAIRDILHANPATFWKKWQQMIWRMFPEMWAPADGLYTITHNDSGNRFGLPGDPFTSVTDPTSLALSIPAQFSGSHVWQITSVVSDNGCIYQTLKNLRSGHVLDYNKTTQQLTGKKRGAMSDERWMFYGAPAGDTTLFAIQDFTDPTKGVVPTFDFTAPAYGLMGIGVTKPWKIERVGVPRMNASYYIINAESGLFLSASDSPTLEQSTHADLAWTITGSGETITIQSSTKGVVLQQANVTDPNDPLRPAMGSTNTAMLNVQIDPSNVGLCFIRTTASDTDRVLGPRDDSNGVAFQPFSDSKDSMRWRWKFVPTDVMTWPSPSWASDKILADGIYRMSNKAKGRVFLQIQAAAVQGPFSVIAGSANAVGNGALWHVQRDATTGLYTLRSMSASSSYLDEKGYLGQIGDGNEVLATGNNQYTQQWMARNPKSSRGWVFQHMVSGSLLDAGDADSAEKGNYGAFTTPPLTANPALSQVWSLQAVKTEVSTGIYRIYLPKANGYLSSGFDSRLTTSIYADWGKGSYDWQVIRLKNGFYSLKPLQTRHPLSSDINPDGTVSVGTKPPQPGQAVLAPYATHWTFRKSPDNMWTIESAQTHMCISQPYGVTGSGIAAVMQPRHLDDKVAWQSFSLMRVDQDIGGQSYGDYVSDKFEEGMYTIFTADNAQFLASEGPQAPPSLLPKSNSVSFGQWYLKKAGCGGYYTLTCRNGTLCVRGEVAEIFMSDVIIGVDETCWKIVRFPSGCYRLINKANGLLLNTGFGFVIDGESSFVEWIVTVTPPNPDAVRRPIVMKGGREVAVSNGTYLIQGENAPNVLTAAPDQGNAPSVTPRDVSVASIDAKNQVWVIEKKPDGWYGIKSFPYNLSLCGQISGAAGPVLLTNPSDAQMMPDQTAWKFVLLDDGQKGSNMRLICRAYPDAFLAIADNKTSLMPWMDDPNQRWKLIRASTLSLESISRLPQGTYKMSSYGMGFYQQVRTATAALVTPADGAGAIATPDQILAMKALSETLSSSASKTPASVSAMLSQINWTALAQAAATTTAILPGPPTLTWVNGDFQQASPLSMDVSQYWSIYQAPGTNPDDQLMWITRFNASGGSLWHGPDNKVTMNDSQTPPTNWKVAYQEATGGYAIFSTKDGTSNMVLAIDLQSNGLICEPYIPKDDGTGNHKRQRFMLNRQGYYLQNQEPTFAQQLLSVAADFSVGLATYRPFSQASTINVGGQEHRMDAHNTWILVKTASGGTYQIMNEQSTVGLGTKKNDTTQLDCSGDANNYQDIGGFKLIKPTPDGRSLAFNYQKDGKEMCLTATGFNSVSLQPMGDPKQLVNQPKMCWKPIPVATTDRGGLLDLPRVVIAPDLASAGGDLSLVYSTDPSNPDGWRLLKRPYNQDDGFQRWRVATYSNLSVYYNEATGRYFDTNNQTYTMAETTAIGYAAWFESPSPFIGGVFKNTGDLPSSTSTLRIQIEARDKTGNVSQRVLSADATGAVTLQPVDLVSTLQLWTVIDWDRGRWIVHVPTGKLLAIDPANNTLNLTDGFNNLALWRFDPTRQKKGYLPLISTLKDSDDNERAFVPVAQDSGDSKPWKLALAPATKIIRIDSGGHGPAVTGSHFIESVARAFQAITENADLPLARFVRTSSRPSLFSDVNQMKTFLAPRLPVFVHEKHSPLPIGVDTYLSRSTLSNRSTGVSYSTATQLPSLPTGDSWIMHYTGAYATASDGAEAYVVLRNADEQIYYNYTDVIVFCLYPYSGWKSITLRFNNETLVLEAVKFPGDLWVPNYDLNFSALCLPENNPLKLVKRSDAKAQTRLHIYVDSMGTFKPQFPAGTANIAIVDDTKWGGTVDASAKYSIVSAEPGMNIGDEQSASWMSYTGAWNDMISGDATKGPRAVFGSPRGNPVTLLSITYGPLDGTPKDMMDQPLTVQNALSAIANRRPFPVTLPMVGIDPFPFIQKTLTVKYIEGGFTKTRSAVDYASIDFGKDVLDIEYGHSRVTNQAAYDGALESLLNPGTPFAINNTNMGGDPWPWTAKKGIIRYVDGGIVKTRPIIEHQNLNFNTDVTLITWGQATITDPVVFSAALQTLIDPSVPFLVSNDTFGYDPAPGQAKTCEVTIRSDDGSVFVKDGNEGEFLALANVGKEIKKITYGDVPVYDSAVFARAWNAATGGGFPFKVWPDVLGFDPSVGVVKTCTITMRRGDGSITTVSGQDGEVLNSKLMAV